MLELLYHQPIFVGFKVSSNLKRQLELLSGPDKKYVSIEDSTYLARPDGVPVGNRPLE